MHFSLTTPIGNLGIRFIENKLFTINFLLEKKIPTPKKLSPEVLALIQELKNYFKKPDHRFKLVLEPQGTPFQKAVWKALQKIPCGKTLSYQALAQQLKTSPRAIGNACRANPFPLLIPCHRVIAKKGLGGFAGKNGGKLLDIKRWLLRHEGFNESEIS